MFQLLKKQPRAKIKNSKQLKDVSDNKRKKGNL